MLHEPLAGDGNVSVSIHGAADLVQQPACVGLDDEQLSAPALTGADEGRGRRHDVPAVFGQLAGQPEHGGCLASGADEGDDVPLLDSQSVFQ